MLDARDLEPVADVVEVNAREARSVARYGFIAFDADGVITSTSVQTAGSIITGRISCLIYEIIHTVVIAIYVVVVAVVNGGNIKGRVGRA